MSPDAPLPRDISAEARAILGASGPHGAGILTAGEVERLRSEAWEREAPAGFAAAERAGVAFSDVTVAGIPVMRVAPATARRRSSSHVLLHAFGGAFLRGSPEQELVVTAPLADRLGIDVVVPRYRLAPEHPCPAALEDMRAVRDRLLAGHGAGRLALSGESAGGNLALHLALDGPSAALALLSPWVDLAGEGDTMATLAGVAPNLGYAAYLGRAARLYAAGRPLGDQLVSPLRAPIRGEMPPVLVTSGTRDPFLSDCARLTTRWRAAGAEAALHVREGMWHVFEYADRLPEGAASLGEVASFLGARLGLPPRAAPGPAA